MQVGFFSKNKKKQKFSNQKIHALSGFCGFVTLLSDCNMQASANLSLANLLMI